METERKDRWARLYELEDFLGRHVESVNLNQLINGKYSVSADKGNKRYLYGVYDSKRAADRAWEFLAGQLHPKHWINNTINH
jgi:hypothetical protein